MSSKCYFKEKLQKKSCCLYSQIHFLKVQKKKKSVDSWKKQRKENNPEKMGSDSMKLLTETNL